MDRNRLIGPSLEGVGAKLQREDRAVVEATYGLPVTGFKAHLITVAWARPSSSRFL